MKLTVIRPSGSDTATIQVAGEMDVVSSPDLLETFEHLYTEGRDHVVVDLHEVTFLDSSGISALVAGRKHAERRGGWLRVSDVSGAPRRTLEITGVLDLLTGNWQHTGPSWWIDSGDPAETDPSGPTAQGA